MALGDLTRADVLKAVAEFDELGRDEFLRRYGFGKAKSYFLEVEGKLYDSKAIAGAALGMAAGDFSGGDQTVARRMAALDFTVKYFPVRPWTREETILACVVLAANSWRQLPDAERDPRVIELSELLQTAEFHPLEEHGPDFRNINSVARKMADIAANHLDHRGKQTWGSRLDASVAREFVDNPTEMMAEARALRAKLLGLRPEQVKTPDVASRNAFPVVFDMPVEAHRTRTFPVSGTSKRNASRVEAELVKRFREWRRKDEHSVIAKGILLPGETRPLRVDLYDVDRAELIEAKGSAEREYVRLALGQVLDYARYVEHEHLAVLLPELPKADLVDLLSRHGVRCIYEVAEGKFGRN
ncbi:hypothetical protein [Kutzneria sp. CA-103260]|uniref:hypothetical protein n=1 Tax=Kutzneria sp. CA-103260 TaxID=2802641 RepID=UPI001BAAE261|nr:hypothetical protein [Kutzneria sp. CA-103260]QUQ70163.1 hypothetical protein JJ691_79370 [Kutzneria sp. CA-103260]